MPTPISYPLVALSLLIGTSAWATSSYPSVISNEAGATRVSQCIVCHANNSGGSGTAVKPFADALRARGLPNDEDTGALRTAFRQLATDAIDSDGDGTIDTDEIEAYRNPNVALTGTVDDCQSAGQCQPSPDPDGGTDGGTDGGVDAGSDGGAVIPEPLPDPMYGVGCTSAGGMQALGGLLLLGAAALRLVRRRE